MISARKPGQRKSTVSPLIVLAAVLAAGTVRAAGQAGAPAAGTVAGGAAEVAPSRPSPMAKVMVTGLAQDYDARREDTASKSVVTQEEIVKYGDTSTLDVLKRVPGVTITGSTVRMRGLGAGYTQILVNGDRPPPGFSLETLSPAVIERIEVSRAATADVSTQAVAGSINIILKRTIQTAQRNLRLGYADERNEHGPNATVLLADKEGARAWSLALNMSHSDEHRLISGEEAGWDASGVPNLARSSRANVDPMRGTNLSFTPRVTWTLAPGEQLNVQGFVNASRSSNDGEGTTVTTLGAPLDYPALRNINHNGSDHARVEGNWTRSRDGNKLDIKLSLGKGHSHRDLDRSAGANLDAPMRFTSIPRHTGYWQVSTQGKYSYGGVEGHAFTIGWDGGTTDSNEHMDKTDQLVGASPVVDLQRSTAQIARIALFAQDEWRIQPLWSLYLGTRWESVHIFTEGNRYAPLRSRSNVFSPIVQTLYKLDAKGESQLRLALSRTYRAPSTGDLVPSRVESLNNSSTEPDQVGNPALQPELALGVDAAFERFWSNGGLFSVSAGYREINNYIRRVVVEERPHYFSSMPVNAGRAHVFTLEVELKFRLNQLWRGMPPVDLRASVGRNRSRVDGVPGPYNRLDQQVPLSATLGADYRGAALTMGGALMFSQGGPVQVSTTQLTRLQSRRELDLYGLWKFSAATQLRIAVNNLTGIDRTTDDSFVEGTGTVRRFNRIPFGPRLVTTLEHKF